MSYVKYRTEYNHAAEYNIICLTQMEIIKNW